jgi:hypothetical protein
MKIRGLFLSILVGLMGSMLAGGVAQASQVLYDGVGFVQGTQSFSESFNLPSAGVLTVTLGNVAWPQQLSSLNMLVTSASGAAGPEMGTGTSSFKVGAGNVYTQWFGTAQGPLDAGVYSLEIQFSPTYTTGQVPLPTSIALLVSGLGLLIWQRRTRNEEDQPQCPGSGDIQAA